MGKGRNTQVIVATLQKYQPTKKRENLSKRKTQENINLNLNMRHACPQSFSFVRFNIPTST